MITISIILSIIRDVIIASSGRVPESARSWSAAAGSAAGSAGDSAGSDDRRRHCALFRVRFHVRVACAPPCRAKRANTVRVCVCVCVAANEIDRDAHIGVLWRDIYRNKRTRQSE
jgi:hypothetical protein